MDFKGVLPTVLTGLCFGFGFAIGQSLWVGLLALFSARGGKQP